MRADYYALSMISLYADAAALPPPPQVARHRVLLMGETICCVDALFSRLLPHAITRYGCRYAAQSRRALRRRMI